MTPLKDRRAQFIRELPTIISLILLQTWLNFNFPALARLGGPFGVVAKLLLSIACAYVFVWAVVFPERFVPLVTLDFFDDFPDPEQWKRIFKAAMLFIVSSTFLYIAYVDFYHMPPLWYGIWGLCLLVEFVLFYRVVRRSIVVER